MPCRITPCCGTVNCQGESYHHHTATERAFYCQIGLIASDRINSDLCQIVIAFDLERGGAKIQSAFYQVRQDMLSKFESKSN